MFYKYSLGACEFYAHHPHLRARIVKRKAADKSVLQAAFDPDDWKNIMEALNKVGATIPEMRAVKKLHVNKYGFQEETAN